MKKLVVLTPVMGLMLMIATTSPIDKATMERGKKVYTQYCITCHQPDGGGVPGLNPPLEKTTYVLGSKTKLIRIVLKGMDTHEEIDGETYSNIMAPHNFLTDQQIADVLTYVRNSFGNKAIAVTPGDVKYVRARTK
ncbi:MAG TPA: c-type cytochrome [Chitinophagaceae bacterium]